MINLSWLLVWFIAQHHWDNLTVLRKHIIVLFLRQLQAFVKNKTSVYHLKSDLLSINEEAQNRHRPTMYVNKKKSKYIQDIFEHTWWMLDLLCPSSEFLNSHLLLK